MFRGIEIAYEMLADRVGKTRLIRESVDADDPPGEATLARSALTRAAVRAGSFK